MRRVLSANLWPIGQADYRTGAALSRLRKNVVRVRKSGNWNEVARQPCLKSLSLERLTQFFPLRHPALQFRPAPPQFLCNPLGFLSADEGLQGSLIFGDRVFQAVDFGLEFVDAIFHLLAFDGIQALGRGILGLRRLSVGIAIRRLRMGW